MAERIRLQVARYRPEQESEASFDEYDVPCPKEWVVLDGLNHVKDRIDGTLAYRWSCRMGICGSCGMTGQRRAETDLRDVPRRLRARPGAGGAAQELSRHPRPDRRSGRFHAQAGSRQAVDRAADRNAGERRRVPADTRGARRVQAVQHVHQLHAVLCGLSDLRARSEVHRSRGDCAGAALQSRQPRRGRSGADGGALGT